MNNAEPPYESLLIDVTSVTLEQLRMIDDSTLAHAVRRALREAEEKPHVLAAFLNVTQVPDSPADAPPTQGGAD